MLSSAICHLTNQLSFPCPLPTAGVSMTYYCERVGPVDYTRSTVAVNDLINKGLGLEFQTFFEHSLKTCRGTASPAEWYALLVDCAGSSLFLVLLHYLAGELSINIISGISQFYSRSRLSQVSSPIPIGVSSDTPPIRGTASPVGGDKFPPFPFVLYPVIYSQLSTRLSILYYGSDKHLKYHSPATLSPPHLLVAHDKSKPQQKCGAFPSVRISMNTATLTIPASSASSNAPWGRQ
ncbi:uncharacterized protein H6S33_011084 [Morchella sextelata]|uniref:uncharacterized protein n=1 Tax=Morchella sextelata TaxID=1174677 RepID=UPI001D03AAE9|nr:uncharacterized protein H6S33_011084 [Morchella sextelata]KAH0611819.1 hypothetical protein H6S33_011084 [Morchella sextelata]